MAKIKEISFSVGRKISDGDYGSYDFHHGERVELDDGDSYKEEVVRLRNRVNKRAEEIIAQIKNANAPKHKRTKKDD